MTYRKLRPAHAAAAIGFLVLPILAAWPAAADNYSEDEAWQFETPTDFANESAVEGMIQEKRGGEFQKTPTITDSYNTTNSSSPIQNQTNCLVESTATGNAGSNTEGGNTASASGASASSTGNSSANTLSGEGGTYASGTLANDPANSGTIGSTASGNSTGSSSSGAVSEALNSTQSNEAAQSSSQTGNIACKVVGSGSLN
jgi:cellulose 1,4-beta-cellobiosidase